MTAGHNGRDISGALLVIVVWPDGSTDLTCRVRTPGGGPDRLWLAQTLRVLLARVKAGRT
jgi:hypothetical protein